MVSKELNKYVIENRQIIKLEDYPHPIQDEGEYPINCISVYYKIKDGNVIERMCVANWDVSYQPAFKKISIGWLEEYFAVEEADLVQLNAPGREIVEKGGEIFSLVNGENKVVGVTAVLNHGTHAELGKMGVLKEYNGSGYSNPLMHEALLWAKHHPNKFTHVDIHTASNLTPAITLYKKFGFKTVPLEHSHVFTRVDMAMRLDL